MRQRLKERYLAAASAVRQAVTPRSPKSPDVEERAQYREPFAVWIGAPQVIPLNTSMCMDSPTARLPRVLDKFPLY